MTEPSQPKARQKGDMIYALLLCLYPPAFRRRFGDEMLEVYRAEQEMGRGRAALGPPRFHAVLLSLFAALALALASVGIHGVIAHSVRQRRNEIGIRIALGASTRAILAMIWSRGMIPVTVGVVLGLGAAVALSKTIESFLFGVDRLDPLSYMALPLALVAVAATANFFPALAATSIDPVETLRSE